MALLYHHLLEDNANDSVGSWNLTEVGSPTYTSSGAPNKNKAIQLNGTSQYLIRANTDFTGFSDLTLSFIIYPNSLVNNACMFAVAERIFVNTSQLRITTFTTGKIRILLRAGGTSDSTIDSGAGVLVSGRWNFVSLTYDSTDVKLYVDSTTDFSSLVKEVDVAHSVGGAISAPSPDNADLTWGATQDNPHDSFSNFFDCRLDDLRIYDDTRSLSALETIRDEDQTGAPAAARNRLLLVA